MELRDIEIFLTLAEELHFGRTAARLHVSAARVSQAIKKQERSVGAELFERTSRAVRLTTLGEQLRDDLRPLYRGLHQSLERARSQARGRTEVLRVGMLTTNAYELRPFWDAFRIRFPHCDLRLRYTNFTDPFATLRGGEIDALVCWFPVQEPDLTVGPVLFTEPRLLQVPLDHVLADRDSVSLEELGNYPVPYGGPNQPDYWVDEFLPYQTPSRRPVERLVTVGNLDELLNAVSHDGVVHLIGRHADRFHARPDIVNIPVHDSPLLRWGLVWRTDADDDRIRGLVEVARDLGTLAL